MEDSPKTHDSNGSLQLNIEKKYEDKPTTPTHTQNISQPPVVYSSQTWPAMDVALQRPPVVATPPLPRRRIAAAHELGRIRAPDMRPSMAAWTRRAPQNFSR